jgi:uncharacterized protein (DUF433 family)
MTVHSLEQVHAIERSSEVLSGAWRFRGTRVPVAALFENLRDEATVADFLRRSMQRGQDPTVSSHLM